MRRDADAIAPQVAAAARWWSYYLRVWQQAQDPDGATVTALPEAGHRLPPLSAEQVDRFEAVLAELLQRGYREGGGCVGMVLHDRPHPLLEEAAERAGFTLTVPLPVRTTMSILPDGASVIGPTTAYRLVWLHGGPDQEPSAGEPAAPRPLRPRRLWLVP